MKRAIKLANEAVGEVPVGAFIVKDGEVIAEAFNKKERLNDVTAHAEILAIREAARKLGSWRLDGCELYVTLEPCPMCAWAILNSRISTVYFGSYDMNYGAFGSAFDVRDYAGSKIKVYGGIMEKECDCLLEKFFNDKRAVNIM